MTKKKEQTIEIDASLQDLLKASRELAETLIEIDAEKANFAEERKAHKELITTLEERRDYLRDTINSGKHKIPAQKTLGEVAGEAFAKAETEKGRNVTYDPEANVVTINADDEPDGKIQDAKVLVELILEKLTDLPEAAEEFSSSMKEKTLAIFFKIEEGELATDAQIAQLESLAEEVEQWGEPDAD